MYLVATPVTGLDRLAITNVICYDLPTTVQEYHKWITLIGNPTDVTSLYDSTKNSTFVMQYGIQVKNKIKCHLLFFFLSILSQYFSHLL